MLSTFRRISLFPSISSTKLFYLYNFYYPHYLSFRIFLPHFNLSLQIYRDVYKSFRNLPKFFREHARGARTIFHLCIDRHNAQVLNQNNQSEERCSCQKSKKDECPIPGKCATSSVIYRVTVRRHNNCAVDC